MGQARHCILQNEGPDITGGRFKSPAPPIATEVIPLLPQFTANGLRRTWWEVMVKGIP